MKIAVMGAGAMGSLFGGRLAKDGQEVWMIDVWQEHIDKMKKDGLLMEGKDAVEYVPLNATTNSSEVGIVDLLVLFVKGTHTEKAIRDSLPMIGKDSYVLTLQNGIGNVDKIKEVIDENRILFGMTTLSSDLKGPGHIDCTYHGTGLTQMKPLNLDVNERVKEIVATFTQAGLYSEVSLQVETEIWRKLIVNCSLNAITAVTRLNCGRIMEQESSKFLLESVTRELVTVANAAGVQLEYESAVNHLQKVGWEAYEHYPSMVFDFKNKRKTEIDLLTGAVIKEARKHDIPVPVNEALACLIKIIENTYSYQLF